MTVSRIFSAISFFSGSPAREVKRWSARLRARRTRLEMTMSP
jgi:hypothetical protein